MSGVHRCRRTTRYIHICRKRRCSPLPTNHAIYTCHERCSPLPANRAIYNNICHERCSPLPANRAIYTITYAMSGVHHLVFLRCLPPRGRLDPSLFRRLHCFSFTAAVSSAAASRCRDPTPAAPPSPSHSSQSHHQPQPSHSRHPSPAHSLQYRAYQPQPSRVDGEPTPARRGDGGPPSQRSAPSRFGGGGGGDDRPGSRGGAGGCCGCCGGCGGCGNCGGCGDGGGCGGCGGAGGDGNGVGAGGDGGGAGAGGGGGGEGATDEALEDVTKGRRRGSRAELGPSGIVAHSCTGTRHGAIGFGAADGSGGICKGGNSARASTRASARDSLSHDIDKGDKGISAMHAASRGRDLRLRY